MKLAPWLIGLSLILIGCSGSKTAQNVSQETPQIELSDADEFIDNPAETPAEVATESSTEGSASEPIVADDTTAEATPADLSSAAPVIEPEEIANTATTSASSGEKTYTVQKNETLMLIAFKLYGDYEKWKTLANYNKETLKGSTAVSAGMTLKYMAPAEEFVWNPQGIPYLIRTGDTLGGISNNVYGTIKKWKLIWNNNKPLIKNPNLIFSGFTIYYLENGREVAAEI